MPSLAEDLQVSKSQLSEFSSVAVRVLDYMQAIIDEKARYQGYLICSSTIAGTRKRIRPFKDSLFIANPTEFTREFDRFDNILNNLRKGVRDFKEDEYKIVDSIVYTMQQSIGIGLDLLVAPNSARKHVGKRFEELIRPYYMKWIFLSRRLFSTFLMLQTRDKNFTVVKPM